MLPCKHASTPDEAEAFPPQQLYAWIPYMAQVSRSIEATYELQ
jgi:hypothetical protein